MRTAERHETGLLDALREDIETSWAPDPLGGADFPAIAANPDQPSGRISTLEVPRPQLTPMRVYALPFSMHVKLHHSVAHLRTKVDKLLAATVCGYRRGADASQTYREEYERFLRLSRALATENRFSVHADVRRFFQSIRSDVVLDSIERRWPSGSNPVSEILRLMSQQGVVGLPAGYADARLIANLILDDVDASLRAPFTRWVDDYRIFVNTHNEAKNAIQQFADALALLGLKANDRKIRIQDSNALEGELEGEPLESAFHPTSEFSEASHSEVRSIFCKAAEEPIRRRRQLRYSIRRLGESADPIAIDHSLGGLHQTPWELPRLIAYLGNFLDVSAVRQGVYQELTRAAEKGVVWSFIRIVPLAIRLPKSTSVLQSVAEFVARTDVPVAWGLGLRLLAFQGESKGVSALLDDDLLDPRAALAACWDLELQPSPSLRKAAPMTAEYFARGGVSKIPPTKSIL